MRNVAAEEAVAVVVDAAMVAGEEEVAAPEVAAVAGVKETATVVRDASAIDLKIHTKAEHDCSALFLGMSAEQPIEVEGTITIVLPGTMFRVVLDNKHEVLAHISGKMRKHFVRLTVGDRVRMEMSPYDLSKARITYRLR